MYINTLILLFKQENQALGTRPHPVTGRYEPWCFTELLPKPVRNKAETCPPRTILLCHFNVFLLI